VGKGQHPHNPTHTFAHLLRNLLLRYLYLLLAPPLLQLLLLRHPLLLRLQHRSLLRATLLRLCELQRALRRLPRIDLHPFHPIAIYGCGWR
jgi:hypothetical protein